MEHSNMRNKSSVRNEQAKIALRQMFSSSKAATGMGHVTGLVEGVIILVIGLVIIFQVVANLFPTLVSAGNTLNASGIPLGSLFAGSNATLWFILAAALIILSVKMLFSSMKHGK